MDYSRDPRMDLGTDGMEWLTEALFLHLPQQPPWSEWARLPQVPAQRVLESELYTPAPMPTQQARQAMAPWANRLDLPGVGA